MDDKIKVSQQTLDTIRAIRDSGYTNMFDAIVVINFAEAMGDHDTAQWIRDNKGTYAQGIFKGFTAEDVPEQVDA